MRGGSGVLRFLFAVIRVYRKQFLAAARFGWMEIASAVGGNEIGMIILASARLCAKPIPIAKPSAGSKIKLKKCFIVFSLQKSRDSVCRDTACRVREPQAAKFLATKL